MLRTLRSCALLVLAAALLWAPRVWAEDGASWDISGAWPMEGTGFVDWHGLRYSLAMTGNMNLCTAASGDIWCVTSYDMDIRLDVSKLNIKAWSEHLGETFHDFIPLPADMNPSLGKPFELLKVTAESGLTYTVTLTSATSGKVNISGEKVKLGSVSSLKIATESAMWKEGTPKPQLANESSGCNAGGWRMTYLILIALGQRQRGASMRRRWHWRPLRAAAWLFTRSRGGTSVLV